jgi:hypothetical protein
MSTRLNQQTEIANCDGVRCGFENRVTCRIDGPTLVLKYPPVLMKEVACLVREDVVERKKKGSGRKGSI